MTSVPNPSLDAGQQALNQGNYSVAIAHFEGVCETELDDSTITRASQGLVMAYHRAGNSEKAIALCQSLTQHPDSKIREWATTTLTDLRAESSTPLSPSESDATGFAPFDGAPPNPSGADATGFVAFNPTPAQPKTPPSQVIPAQSKQRLASATRRNHPPTKVPADVRGQGLAAPPNQAKSNSESGSVTKNALPHSTLTPRPRWRNSGRTQRLQPLKPIKLIRLWLVEIGTAIAVFWVLRCLVQFVMATTNTILVKLPFFEPFQLFYRDPTLALGIFLVILLIGSPWLIDVVLRGFHSLQLLPFAQLASRHPEAAQVIQRFCRQRRIPLPKLGILPTDAPVALTYGNLPRTARIAVSEGLLAQLTDDEVATIYTSQLGHIVHRDFVLMSLGVLLIQLPYVIYWQVAQWGEQIPSLIERKLSSYRGWLSPLLQAITGVIASISYGIYWLLRLPLLWFSRARVYYSDRIAAETTGNPNGLTRALLKTALGITENIQNNHQTSALLEGFDLLLPVGYQQAISFGSCSPQTPLAALLNWDCTNPYRQWLTITASHPLIGDRLHLLARYAQFWKLDTELDLPTPTPPTRTNATRLSKLSNSYKALPLMQSALLGGLVIGILLRVVLWGLGKIGDQLNIWQLIWMHNASPFLNACVLIAFSLSVFIWINGYFPDLKPSTVRNEPNLGDFFTDPAILPPNSQPVQLTGKLLGRRGLFNWLVQDLILQTSTGLVKLHFLSYLGPFGHLLPQRTRPSDLVEQQVTVTGWFRRGATPWIDVETLRTLGGKTIRANYPIWITLLALAGAVWGAYLIWQA